jgi:hypothetical protein
MNKLFVLIFIALLSFSNVVYASPAQVKIQKTDSIKPKLDDSISSLLDFHADYLTNSEIEHQKVMRNIFGVGFVLLLGLLIFTIVFYGNKIKKVSKIILLQNDVVNSSKDQLVKIINIFNYIDQQIYITDSKGNVEWINSFASKWFIEDFEKNKISLLTKFKAENQGIVFQGINEDKPILFIDNLNGKDLEWKMIPIKNSKGEFSNMIFVGA